MAAYGGQNDGVGGTPYHGYKVVKPVDVMCSNTANWIDGVGGGTQHKFFDSIDNLLKN